ncbi:hypothetical protein ACHAPT_001440 [Fusarium lateritium]
MNFEKPDQDLQTPPPDAREWMKTRLDDICPESFQASPQPQPRRQRHNYEKSGRLPRKLRAQYRLTSQGGLMALRSPQSWYSQLTGYRIGNAGPETQHRDALSSLFTLPVEIRLCIYRHLLISKSFPTIYPDPSGFRVLPPVYYNAPVQAHPQILATCRQINREATPILYSENIFRREFLWRREYMASGLKPIPRFESSPLREANLLCIQRVRIFRTYRQWFRDANLKVLKDFPTLRELQVHMDANDIWGDLSYDRHWKDAMRAISRDRPDLTCIKTQIRLAFDERYRAWCERCRAKPLDFSVHRIKKDELERWMQSEGLFPGRERVWSFDTQTSEWCGPSCVIALTMDSSRKAMADVIECRIQGDQDTEYSIEPAQLE